MTKFFFRCTALVLLFISTQAAESKDLWGYVDDHGKRIIKPQFADAWRFMHGFARCTGYSQSTGKPDWQSIIFVDKNGHELKIPSNTKQIGGGSKEIYDRIKFGDREFVQNNYIAIWSKRGPYVFVKRNFDFCIANESGKVLKIFPSTWSVKGVNPKTNNQWVLVDGQAFDFTGKGANKQMPGFEPVEMPMLYEKQYDYFDGFSEGLAAVRKNDGHWAYIDADGKEQIKVPDDCSNAQTFSEGLAVVSVGGRPCPRSVRFELTNCGAKFGFIDHQGRFVIPPKFPCPPDHWFDAYSSGAGFHNGLALATADKNGAIAYGYIDKTGNFVVPAIYKSVSPFSEGVAAVNAAAPGFEPDKWLDVNRKIGGMIARDDQFLQFLRQYDFIGMGKMQVETLLGPAETGREGGSFYFLSGGCTGSVICAVRYQSDRVSGYTVHGYGVGSPTSWVSQNYKPDWCDDLRTFCVAHAEGNVSPGIDGNENEK